MGLFIQYIILVVIFFLLDCYLDDIFSRVVLPGCNLFIAVLLAFACEVISHGLVIRGIILGLFIILFGKFIYIVFLYAPAYKRKKDNQIKREKLL